MAKMMRKSTFQIEEMRRGGQQALAIVKITIPNMEVIMNDMMNIMTSSIGRGMDTDDFDNKLKNMYSGRPIPMITTKKGVALVREGDQWLISAGWPQEEQVLAHISKAQRHESYGDFKEAKEQYQQVLALNPSLIEIQDKIKSLEFRMMPVKEANRAMDDEFDRILHRRR